jgi:UDP:flavonoid glycosyltransferase YjiC (YdhE family)
MSTRKKIIIFPIPAVGHSNPILKTANELIKRYNAQVIIYTIITFQSQVENIGAEYRKLNDKTYDEIMQELNLNNSAADLISQFLGKNYESADKNSLRLAKEIDQEKPDLVLYDSFSFHAKIAMRILTENYKRIEELKDSTDPNIFIPTLAPPSFVVYWTTFTNGLEIYPNEYEKPISLNLSLWEKLKFIFILYKLSRIANNLSKKFQISYKSPFEDLLLRIPQEINIVFTFPELHPRSHLFERKTMFVGACINDTVHINGEAIHENSKVNELLKIFPVRSYDLPKHQQNKKLIYVSLGTAFNENTRLFSLLIDAFNRFDELSLEIEDFKLSKTELKDLKILFSLGPTIYKHFDELIKDNKIKITDNVILAPSVPQLEVLKRASLFITHSGMNSTSESIHYAVPMICVPLNGDQPLNAHRVATELGLGVIVYLKTVTSGDICTAIHKIFADSSFYDRCTLYSNLSRQHIGHQNAAEKIMEAMK